jgi:hypothetical protein
MIELDVDVSGLSVPEQRMLAGLTPLLDAAREGVLRAHAKPIPGAWRLVPNATRLTALDLIAPSGAVRASLSRPIVLGALKRMMAELSDTATPRIVQPSLAKLPPTPASAPAKTIVRAALGAATLRGGSAPLIDSITDPRGFAGSSDMPAFLEALMQAGPGVFDLRFANGESVRIDRGNNSFRCRGFNRSNLYMRLMQQGALWAQLPDKARPKSDETQASMGPLLFTIGVLTAKERFILGVRNTAGKLDHTELEFQIRTPVAYARFADFGRIAEAFKDFSPVADAAQKLAIAPIEVLSCLNGYAALGLTRSRARSHAPAKSEAQKALDLAKTGGLFSRIKARFT